MAVSHELKAVFEALCDRKSSSDIVNVTLEHEPPRLVIAIAEVDVVSEYTVGLEKIGQQDIFPKEKQ
jgi:hypothetical protein